MNWTLAGTAAVENRVNPGLSGYLLAKGALVETVPFDATTSDTVGSMFLEIPLGFGRDLYDFDFSMQGGRVSVVQQQRPAACRDRFPAWRLARTLSPLTPGSGPVVPGSCCVDGDDLGSERLEVVRRRVVDGGLRRRCPATKPAPAGAYLAVFGPAGSTARACSSSKSGRWEALRLRISRRCSGAPHLVKSGRWDADERGPRVTGLWSDLVAGRRAASRVAGCAGPARVTAWARGDFGQIWSLGGALRPKSRAIPASHRQRTRCSRDTDTRAAPCAGTAGGSPRRRRTGARKRVRSRW